MSAEETIEGGETSTATDQPVQTEQDPQTSDPNWNRRVLRSNRIIETVTNTEPPECDSQCNGRSPSPSDVPQNEETERDGIDFENMQPCITVHRCDICEATFSTKRNIKRHKDTVHERLRPYECDVCHRFFGTRYTMVQHKKARHRPPGIPRIIVRRHACPICFKMFTTKGNVAYHKRRVHEKLMPYQCTICDRKFGSKGHLLRHNRCVHEQLRPYQCEVCGKRFGDNSSLKEHVAAVHSTETPYSCPFCPRCFSTKRALQCHKDGVHSDLREHQCTDCNKAYKRPQALVRHRLLVHGKGVFFPCSDCDARCLGPVSLQHHRRTYHGKSDINRFASELPKVEDLIGGEPADLSEWNLEQMQMEIDKRKNHFAYNPPPTLSTDGDAESGSDYDSEQTLPLSEDEDEGVPLQINSGEPVDWVIEVDNNRMDEQEELQITRAVIPACWPTDNTLPRNRRRVTYIAEDFSDDESIGSSLSSSQLNKSRSSSASILSGRRLASLRLHRTRVGSAMNSHAETLEVPICSNLAESATQQDTQSVHTTSRSFIVRPNRNFKLMRKRLGSFLLLKIARAPTSMKVPVRSNKSMKIDFIAERLAASQYISSASPLVLDSEVLEF